MLFKVSVKAKTNDLLTITPSHEQKKKITTTKPCALLVWALFKVHIVIDALNYVRKSVTKAEIKKKISKKLKPQLNNANCI